jgi:dienelactone hydrolase
MWILFLLLLAAICLPAKAGAADPEPFHAFGQLSFPSLDVTGGAPIQVTGYLFRPAASGPSPAVVLMHGCGGLVNGNGRINVRETDYAGRLTQAGYFVLLVDSFTPRGVRNMCSPATLQLPVLQVRPKDAYGALLFLQAKPFVRPHRIGLIGWSQGGGAVLMTIRTHDSPRPGDLPHGDFRTAIAIAFYPGSCSERQLKPDWTTKIPVLVLIGEKDVWTPLEPCRVVLDHAITAGAPVELHTYPGAYHDFDYPGVRLHEEPENRTTAGVIPIVGTDPVAREDALIRVPAFLARTLLN